MERKKLRLPEESPFVCGEATLPDGMVIRVRTSIPRAEKEEAATEIIAMGTKFDETLGICYQMACRDVTTFFVLMKYYTDIDVEPFDSPKGWYALYDMLSANDMGDQLIAVAKDDIENLMVIARRMEQSSIAIFERENSLSYQIQQSLQGLLTEAGRDQTVREARAVNEFLVQTLGMAKERKTPGAEKPRVLGAGLSFAKKKTE